MCVRARGCAPRGVRSAGVDSTAPAPAMAPSMHHARRGLPRGPRRADSHMRELDGQRRGHRLAEAAHVIGEAGDGGAACRAVVLRREPAARRALPGCTVLQGMDGYNSQPAVGMRCTRVLHLEAGCHTQASPTKKGRNKKKPTKKATKKRRMLWRSIERTLKADDASSSALLSLAALGELLVRVSRGKEASRWRWCL